MKIIETNALVKIVETSGLPEMKSDEGKKLMEDIALQITKFINHLRTKSIDF